MFSGDRASSPVYITEQLERRPAHPIDPERENAALLALGEAMANHPDDLLPLLAELAADLTGGTAAGLSLYEPDPAPGVFRWRHVHGALAQFDGTLTPRNDSPCGVTLDRNEPTLAAHPELIYDWIAQADLVVPEVLLVPLEAEDEEPLGTLWIVGPSEGHFTADHARLGSDIARFAGSAMRLLRGQQRLRASLDEQEIVAREMGHRLNNMFAITNSLIHSSARSADSVPELAEMLSGRIRALAAANAVVKRQVRDLGNCNAPVDLAEVLAAITTAREGDGTAQRFTLSGPGITCGDHAANSLALIVHELATNAVKYGALGSQSGRVTIDWRLADDRLVLCWKERGGAPVAGPPERSGFGTTLIQRTMERQFGGEVELDWHRDGLTVTLTAPLDRLTG